MDKLKDQDKPCHRHQWLLLNAANPENQLFPDLLQLLLNITGASAAYLVYFDESLRYVVDQINYKPDPVDRLNTIESEVLDRKDVFLIEDINSVDFIKEEEKEKLYPNMLSFASFAINNKEEAPYAVLCVLSEKKLVLNETQKQSFQLIAKKINEDIVFKSEVDDIFIETNEFEDQFVFPLISNWRQIILNKSKELLNLQFEVKDLADSLPACISIIDKNFCYRFNNRTYENWFERKREDLFGKHIEILLGESTPKYIKLFKRVFNGECISFEGKRVFNNGETKYLHVHYLPSYTLNRTIDGAIVFVEDITKLKLAQLALEETNQELKYFTSMASHDLKAPLRNMCGFSELLLTDYKDKLDAEGRSYLEFIMNSSQQLNSLIDDLLEYAVAGKTLEGKYTTIHLKDVFDMVNKNLLSDIIEKDAIIHPPKHFPLLKMRFNDVVQIFQNLIGNSIKYQKENNQPIISVEVKDQEKNYLILIKDNGIGIPQEQLEKVFTPFYRLHRNDTYSGSGIGLATCKKIIEKYNGKLWVESIIDEGSVFYFTLPKLSSENY